MLMRFFIPVLLITLLVTACTGQPSTPVQQEAPPASQPEPLEPTTEPPAPEPVQDTAPDAETALPNCLGDEVSPIGQSIADEYDFTSYEEVITWFCSGAEFEDILVALETESQTGTPAEEMLAMLADGFTWEEIWQLEGLTD